MKITARESKWVVWFIGAIGLIQIALAIIESFSSNSSAVTHPLFQTGLLLVLIAGQVELALRLKKLEKSDVEEAN